MSEIEGEVKQELLDIRYFAERMLRGLNANDQEEQVHTLFELARLAAMHNNIDPVRVYMNLLSIWNGETARWRSGYIPLGEARPLVFRIFGEMFGKYGLNGGWYEGDEL